MSGVTFAVTGARADPAAAGPTVRVGLRISAPPRRRVQSILLRCQVRIEPERRRYDEGEQSRLIDVFGAPHRWSETLRSFLLTHVTLPVRGFTGSTDVDLPLELSYDLEVGAGKYLHAVRDGVVPLVLLFSGTVFHDAPGGVQVEQIPWDREAQYDLPVAVWTAAIDAHYPGTGWLRLRRDTIDALMAYKARAALPTWDDVVADLLRDRNGGTPTTVDSSPRAGAAGNGDATRGDGGGS